MERPTPTARTTPREPDLRAYAGGPEVLSTTLAEIVDAVASLTPERTELVVVVSHLLRSRARWVRRRHPEGQP